MSTLTSKSFKRMVSAGKTYLPKVVSKELRAAKMGGLLTGRSVTQPRAIKALRYLREKKLLPATKRPQQLFNATLKKQQELEALELDETRGRHVRAQIGLDITEELQQEERGVDPLSKRYHPASLLGEHQQARDALVADQERRQRAIRREHGQQKTETAKEPTKKKPTPVELPPAIDIG